MFVWWCGLTENAVNSAPRSQPARAGLILRTSSFTSRDSHDKGIKVLLIFVNDIYGDSDVS